MRQAIYDFVYSSLRKAGWVEGSADRATAISSKYFDIIKQEVSAAEAQMKASFSHSRRSASQEEPPKKYLIGSAIKRTAETSQEYHTRRMREMGITK